MKTKEEIEAKLTKARADLEEAEFHLKHAFDQDAYIEHRCMKIKHMGDISVLEWVLDNVTYDLQERS